MVNLNPTSSANSPIKQPDVGEVQETQKQGVSDTKGSGPAPVLSGMGDTSGVGALPSLAQPLKTAEAAALILLALKNESTDLQLKSSQDVIKNEATRKKEQHEERLQKLEESAKAMEKAEKGGVFGKVFSWVATGALAVAGAALVATGAGAVAGAILLAMAADMAYSQISGEGSMMSKATAELAKGLEKMGIPEPGSTITATVLVTAAVAVMTAGAGSSAAAAKGASTAANATKSTVTAAQLGGSATQTAQTAAQINRLTIAAAKVGKMANQAQSAAQMGAGMSNMVAAGYTKDAAVSAADAKAMQALIAKMQAQMEEEADRIKDLIQKMEAAASTVMEILAGNDSTNKNITAQMNKA